MSCYCNVISYQVIYSHSGTVIDYYDTVKCTHLLAQHTSSKICRKVCNDIICVLQITVHLCLFVCAYLICIGFG